MNHGMLPVNVVKELQQSKKLNVLELCDGAMKAPGGGPLPALNFAARSAQISNADRFVKAKAKAIRE